MMQDFQFRQKRPRAACVERAEPGRHCLARHRTGNRERAYRRHVTPNTCLDTCYSNFGVFSRHYRRVKAIFGLIDSVLICLAFIAAYQTRLFLNYERIFYFKFSIDFPVATSAAGSFCD